MIRISGQDGLVLTCSSWAAWRELYRLHSQRPCGPCDGEGVQHWLVEGGEAEEDRWYPVPCKRCGGSGVSGGIQAPVMPSPIS
jgi:hypothetical protein